MKGGKSGKSNKSAFQTNGSKSSKALRKGDQRLSPGKSHGSWWLMEFKVCTDAVATHVN
jgi:hypothetical protein